MKVAEHNQGTIFGEEEMLAIRNVLASDESPSWGVERQNFEADFAASCDARHAIATNSCTAALDICAQLLRLGADDEVIATPQTFWATISALVRRGVRVRFGDIDPHTLNLTPESVEKLLTKRTRAVYVVHYGGNPAELGPLRELTKSRGIPLVEDCAHAIGASWHGRTIGDGDLCCFSFQSLKNMSTLGEGGMLTTNNDRWAEEALCLRIMGVLGETGPHPSSYSAPYPEPAFPLQDHSTFPPIAGARDRVRITNLHELGNKSYLTALQSAVGRVQLKRLPELNARRARIARRYSEALRDIPGLRPIEVPSRHESSWHLFTCLLEPESGVQRDALLGCLRDAGIEIVLRYFPLHLTPVMTWRGHAFGEAPVCERVWFERHVNLPINPRMSDIEVDYVTTVLEDALRRLRCR